MTRIGSIAALTLAVVLIAGCQRTDPQPVPGGSSGTEQGETGAASSEGDTGAPGDSRSRDPLSPATEGVVDKKSDEGMANEGPADVGNAIGAVGQALWNSASGPAEGPTDSPDR